ncbi:MAG: tripartite tricarboxylate transporter substrate binding protein [Ramlibacter sp.]|uniref:Bug family tripartite tricarboxylate transporter substrate binding protein n=1 Tax=Ramlibacter sp. TaxID=1917967 RepID=UPI00260FB24A|nr:tripartite tricarboxylate transporter substrate binding protein [Ramlibacter sp.]MDH4377377.1 tripartite tricarboxylate transporter substrate binding protein [Ramlibacter sp.]
MTLTLRKLLKATAFAACCVAIGAQAQAPANWPGSSNIKVIVPFTAGGASDVLTRMLAERLQGKLGGNWVVENRTGAGGNIGMEAVKAAAPDGTTISSATIGTLSINQFLFAKLNYDPAKDFEYVSKIWENCNALVVAPKNPARNVAEFLDWARKQPKGVNYGSAGIGTTPHLAGELFRAVTGIQAVHVPFRGAAQSMPALMAGDTDFAIDNIASYTPLIKAGRVKALAVTCPERWPTMPEVPTMAEAGVKDFIITSWGAFVLPKGTPAAITNAMSAAIADLAKDPTLREKYLETGAILKPTTPRETAEFAERERVKWKEVVRISGAKME